MEAAGAVVVRCLEAGSVLEPVDAETGPEAVGFGVGLGSAVVPLSPETGPETERAKGGAADVGPAPEFWVPGRENEPLGPRLTSERKLSGDEERTLERELSSKIEEDAVSVSPPLSFRSEKLESPLGCLASPMRPSLSAMATKLVRTLERGRGDPEALVSVESGGTMC